MSSEIDFLGANYYCGKGQDCLKWNCGFFFFFLNLWALVIREWPGARKHQGICPCGIAAKRQEDNQRHDERKSASMTLEEAMVSGERSQARGEAACGKRLISLGA